MIQTDPSWNEGNYYTQIDHIPRGHINAKTILYIHWGLRYKLSEKQKYYRDNFPNDLQCLDFFKWYLTDIEKRAVKQDTNTLLYWLQTANQFQINSEQFSPKNGYNHQLDCLFLSFNTDESVTVEDIDLFSNKLSKLGHRISHKVIKGHYGHISITSEAERMQLPIHQFLNKDNESMDT